MFLTTYKHPAYTSLIHLASASVCNMDAFGTNIEFVQLYSWNEHNTETKFYLSKGIIYGQSSNFKQ